MAGNGTDDAPMIVLRGVHKWFGQFHVLKDINLDVWKGQRIVVCGPSGSGKSTMIRCINRLEEHQRGHIVVDGIELTSDVKNIDATRREVGMVFQHFNLFPHLKVIENLTLAPIWVRKVPKAEAEAIATKLLERVGIPEQAHKFPGQLSGGQQQLRLVVIPQALRVIIPPLTSQYLNLTKNSSLAVAIGYPDFVNVFTGIVLNQTGQAVEVIAITMAFYLSLSLLTSAFMNWYNRRIALVER